MLKEGKEKTKGNQFDLKVLKRLFGFIKPYQTRFYTLIAITLVLAALAPLLPLLISKSISDHLSSGDWQGLLQLFILMLSIIGVQAVLQYYNTYLSGWLGQHIIRDIRVKLYEHIIRLKLSFFDQTPIGRLVTRNISDVETLASVFTEGLAAIFADVLQLIVILSVMFWFNWKLSLISLCTIPLLLISTYIFKESIKKSFDEVRNAVAKLNTFVQEHVTGMSIVQLFHVEKREFEKFQEINHEHRFANLKSVKYYSIYFPVAEVIGAIGTGLLVWYGAQGVLEGWVDNVGVLIAFIMFINLFFRPIRMIADRFNTLQLGIISTSRIIQLLDSTEYISDTGNYVPTNVRGKIRYENVWFGYNDEDYVLRNINFEAHEGETIAFVGATGAGKSSIINLLNRSYDINKGTIYLDGIDIREYSLDELRKHIGVVLQDVFLFSGSIRDNITLGNIDITDAQIWNAAELVGADKFIQQLPDQLNYSVQERGMTLSVGQRQLISFVRAMVYNPKILVMDEATSSVDSETELMIQHAIEKMMKGRTSIIIAHRLATIQHANYIIVLDKGEIQEVGTHQELLDKAGFYWQLNQMQYKTAKKA